MKKNIILVGGIVILVGIGAGITTRLRPWMDRWGATEAEVQAHLPGDEFVPASQATSTRAVTIAASPESIFPWLLQMGADKGGLYSYTWIERAIFCPIVNADRIHPEWQDLSGGFWDVIHPGVFIMERGMMLGIKARAES